MEFRKLGNIVRDILHSPGYSYASIIEGYRLIFYEVFDKNIG